MTPEPMRWLEYIHSDPSVLAGKPAIRGRGTRLPVEFLPGLP